MMHSKKHREGYWEAFIPKSWICLKEYSLDTLRRDLLAGVTVGIVALPLAMAFAIASGVAPERGLFTAIVAGFIISLFGGSRVQISGPTGAFVVIIFDVVLRQGYEGLVIATLMAGVLLILAALLRLGSLMKFVPYPLVTGFTTGIAVIIFSQQIKEFFGLQIATTSANFLEQWGAYFQAASTVQPITLAIAAGTLLAIILIRRFIPVIPWGIAGIVLATSVTLLFNLPVETVTSRFGEIPRILPLPGLPDFHMSFEGLHTLIPDAIVIAFLAGLESLLSAVVADGMTGTRHKSNCELLAQGLGNIGSILFGGIPATGAIARTATNVKTGGKTPVAGMVHALTLFLIMLFFAPLVGKIPLAALSAVLMMVAWNMSELGHFKRLFKAPKGDVLVLLATFFLTVLVDLTVAVEVGLVLAAFLVLKRVTETSKVSGATIVEEEDEESARNDRDAIAKKHIPKGVEVYEIDGPFFFGIAESLNTVLHNLEKPPQVFILRMRKVPDIDATGMHALKEFYYKCKKDGTQLLLAGVKPKTLAHLKEFGVVSLIGKEHILPNIDAALKYAIKLA